MTDDPLISIITIVFNGAKHLQKTIKEIISQTYKDYEYIIIDGNSNDDTINVIKKHNEHITKWISEPDNGLYDAMNKGLKLATGKYIWFINAGDFPYSAKTLDIISELTKDNPDIIYGETMTIDDNYNEIGLKRLSPGPDLTWKSLKNGLIVCHQSILVKKEIAEPYNINYRIAADYDWVLSALKKAKKITYTNCIITNFLYGGLNQKFILTGLKERFIIMIRNFGWPQVIFRHIIFTVRFIVFYIRFRRI